MKLIFDDAFTAEDTFEVLHDEENTPEEPADDLIVTHTTTKNIFYHSNKLLNATLIAITAFLTLTSLETFVNLIRDIYFLMRYMNI